MLGAKRALSDPKHPLHPRGRRAQSILTLMGEWRLPAFAGHQILSSLLIHHPGSPLLTQGFVQPLSGARYIWRAGLSVALGYWLAMFGGHVAMLRSIGSVQR